MVQKSWLGWVVIDQKVWWFRVITEKCICLHFVLCWFLEQQEQTWRSSLLRWVCYVVSSLCGVMACMECVLPAGGFQLAHVLCFHEKWGTLPI